MNGKKIRLITEIFAIIVICLVAFGGVYVQNRSIMENKVKDYKYGEDFYGYRELIFTVSNETNEATNEDSTEDSENNENSNKEEIMVNKEENLTEENYIKTKKIVENRLKKLGVTGYNLSLDKQNGLIYLSIPENSNTDHTVSNIMQVSKFEMKDSKDNSKVFLTNKDIKKASSVYNTTENGTTVYLQIEFNKEGTKILKELSTGEYAKKSEEEKEETHDETTEENKGEKEEGEENNTENTENTEENSNNENLEEKNEQSTENKDEKNEQKEITLAIDENSMITTSFTEPMENGTLNLSMNAETKDVDKINDTLKSASTIANLLNSGELPLVYTIKENKFVDNKITFNSMKNLIFFELAIIAGLVIFLIYKFKLRGMVAGISFLGFIGLFTLLIRYTNVGVTIESIVSSFIIFIINFILIFKFVSTNKQIKIHLEEITNFIPLFLIAVVFSFARWNRISVFGMNIFWGIVLIVVYNLTLTKDMVSLTHGKESESNEKAE